MVHIGLAGIGFMGLMHFVAARRLRGGRVAAVCSRDPLKRTGDWRGVHGNFGPPGQIVDLTDVKKYAQFDQLLADPAIDLVDICLPTRLHTETAIRALQAGKHVLVEKPIALDLKDADAMVRAAEKAGKLLMVAHIVPFFAEFAYALKGIRDGRWGKVQAGHLRRLISRPDWSDAANDPAINGGPAVDLHIHDNHYISLIAGVPKAVFSCGVVENDVVQYLTTQYLYGPGRPAMSCTSGTLTQKGRGFDQGFEIFLENATVVYDSCTCPLTVLTADGRSLQPPVDGGDLTPAFTDELQTAVDAVAQNIMPDLLSGQLARDALALCHKECQSVKSGEVVTV